MTPTAAGCEMIVAFISQSQTGDSTSQILNVATNAVITTAPTVTELAAPLAPTVQKNSPAPNNAPGDTPGNAPNNSPQTAKTLQGDEKPADTNNNEDKAKNEKKKDDKVVASKDNGVKKDVANKMYCN